MPSRLQGRRDRLAGLEIDVQTSLVRGPLDPYLDRLAAHESLGLAVETAQRPDESLRLLHERVQSKPKVVQQNREDDASQGKPPPASNRAPIAITGRSL